ncbi:MAG TPA: DNA polymerase IV [Acidimicrobiia bacterium]|nr:DNA polymerase IV [Acidimicrobiia bacterium]
MAGAHILHVDLDAFYASVEQLLDPSLRGKPVLVGGGVVLAASYEARAFGVSAPMGIRAALARCPQAIVVEGSFGRYREFSERVMDICRDSTPLVEQISVDEAFLDVSGTEHLLGTPRAIGSEIRRRVRVEIGLPISVGIARTKFLAKVASAQAKPDGMIEVLPSDELRWLHALPVRVMWGVGPVMERSLEQLGISSVGDLADTPIELLASRLGRATAAHLHALSRNRDPRPVVLHTAGKSVGAQSALGRGTADPHELSAVLLGLADRVARRLRKKDLAGRTVTVRARFADMSSHTRAATLASAVSTTAALHRCGIPLLDEARAEVIGPITLVGISVSRLERRRALQLELPFDVGDPTRAGSQRGAAALMIDEQLDAARARFGTEAVGRASVLLSTRGRVADAFRELAEKD